MSFWERLTELLKEKGITQKNLSKIAGVTQPSISGWKNGSQPNALAVMNIASYFNVSLEYLLKGGERTGYKLGFYRDLDSFTENPDKNFVNIHFYKDKNNNLAGLGYDNSIYNLFDDGIPLPRHLIGKHHPQKIRVMEVFGDSMKNIQIHSGDLVYFVLSENYRDGLNVIRIEDKLYVRRIEIDIIGGGIKIFSENEKYTPKTLSSDEKKCLQVIGNVICWTHINLN